MKVINLINENGFKGAISIIWKYKTGKFLSIIINIFTKNKPLKDEIVIESHDDFDCNGGAFYNYLIENNYNNKYKIIWLVRRKYNKKLPKNVYMLPLYGPSIRKAYHMCVAKFFTFDCEIINKMREDQVVAYCSHGAGGFKKIKGKMDIPDCVDYLLCESPDYMPIQAEQWSLSVNDKRFVYIGYPCQDIFFHKSNNEFLKISDNKYNKVFLWMPTFRKGGGYKRNDSTKQQKLGIPLFETKEELIKLNEQLKKCNAFLIIKIHPKQDLCGFDLDDLSNMIILTGDKVKKMNIDNYNLIKCADALISDYSAVAFEFLQLNRPIGYTLDDMNDYKIGFVVDDIHKLIAGHEIYNIEELYNFIQEVCEEKDVYKSKREKIRDFTYNYHDGNSSQRLAELFKLEK